MKLRALIVDDNIALARVTQFALDRAGFETQVAKNGQVALELAQEFQFDVVVTDQQMPVMSGTELCRALRELPDYVDCPLLLLTAKGLELELPKLREELGINAVFCKPFSPAAIVNEIKELLGVCV
ncbi:response regulator [Bythopirellula polymerisocia]|uniref:Transcriptional regulatory protein SrrA n=1 Tax=Bythopirellula polymerisocia TaxID=2528003 RepID=A0A5C6CXX4_9BACT|nr:response regulator [Bythopirellula polymerisocia]TWU29462.1 Transcriptional regulatory protein SrrA [Bythopirellula polymerisocia]